MDFHLDRQLRLNVQPEHKSLYKWAINEVDETGRRVGSDQIPWPWTLNFTVTSCASYDSVKMTTAGAESEQRPGEPAVLQRRYISAQLRPGSVRDDGNYHRQTTFSMFGTGRAIKSFQLDIHPITDPAKDEYCTAWGSVSYTTDIDFRNETTDDCIVFYMFVKPDTFNRFAEMVASRAVDEMILSVKDVPGFYSAWSPSISTRDVKVLTNNDEQKIAEPAGFQFSPPRLGAIGTAELFINRRLEFAGSSKAATSEEEQTLDRSQLIAEADSEVCRPTLHMFQSLRRALWSIVCLLALILIVLALR